MTDHAIQIDAFGGPEQLKWREVTVGDPGPGEIRIRHGAVGLNFIDVYHRTGLYPLKLPHGIGMEGSGTVEAVGEGVEHLKAGDRAAYASAPPGAYCTARVMPATQVCALPDAVDFEQGAAMMLQGLTVQYLFRQTATLSPGDTVLFHAAAGGVGLIACQWAKAMGVTLIGTAGTDEKCERARAAGATHTINYRTENFVERVRELTAGRGVKVVMDSVGKDTWEGSLDCLEPLGLMITYGNASGKVPPVDVGVLGAKGSIFLTRPTLFTYISSRERCQAMADDLFSMVTTGKVAIKIGQRYKLADAAEAHHDLEARKTTGTTIFTV